MDDFEPPYCLFLSSKPNFLKVSHFSILKSQVVILLAKKWLFQITNSDTNT